MFLQSFLTTIPRPGDHPVKLAELGFRVGTRVTIPYLDSRTCAGIEVDMHETEIIEKLLEYGGGDTPIRDKTLAVALKVYYRNRILFHGPLSAPRWDYDTGKVELVGHDPSLRLKRAFLRTGDSAISSGITLDGEGLLTLLDFGQNTLAQDALNWPALGIIRGLDTTSDYSDKSTVLQRGDNIWEAIKQIADSFIGPDFDLEPIETDPAELASGTDEWITGGVIGDGATLDFELDVVRSGNIGGLRLGIWAEHANPNDVRIDLIHPDGTTVRVYTGSRDDAASATDFLGTGDTSGTLAFFAPGGDSIYASGETYPHVGTFRGDRSVAAFLDKPAAGTWILRVHDVTTNTMSGFLNYFRLTFDLPEPAYCRMNVSDKPDTADPEAIAPDCTFYKGTLNENARILAVTPQGDLVRNQFIATSRSGTKIRVDDLSRADYGTYQGYDSPGENNSQDYLATWADMQVGAYARPVPAFELAPVDDGGQNDALRYGEDFHVGGFVRAIGKRGSAFHDVVGRVQQAVLTQGKSSVQTDLDVVPLASASSDIADG